MLAILLLCGLLGCMRAEDVPAGTEADAPSPSPTNRALVTPPTPEPSDARTPEPTPEQTPDPTPEPTPQRSRWTLSFAGDCTIGTLHEWQDTPTRNNMLAVMNGDWSYPFSGVSEVFLNDDFTMVNLEGAFTLRSEPAAKTYRFRAPPEAAQCLTLGGVEAVTLANNHSGDYRAEGFQDTKDTLDTLGVLWADAENVLIAKLPDDGPRLGVIAFSCVEIDLYAGDVDAYMRRVEPLHESCMESGCDLVVAFLHWGVEYRTEPERWMVEFAHRLAELGCDAVIGSHPHVLQCAEVYAGVPIVYSLGNFCFGGNSGPEDTDSAILQLPVLRTDGGFSFGEAVFLPCCISSASGYNDFRPRLYAPGEPEYERILERLEIP